MTFWPNATADLHIPMDMMQQQLMSHSLTHFDWSVRSTFYITDSGVSFIEMLIYCQVHRIYSA